jgi:pimeloyl-ACP methyl ester carboxylesterase
MRWDFTDRYIDVDDLRIRYWDEGEGAPLLLLHGLGVSVETWSQNVEALARQFRVIAADIPGYGKSTRPASSFYSLEHAGTFMGHLIDALGLPKVSLAGNSMGGMLSIQFALMYPERVDKLILVGSAGLGCEITWPMRMLTIWPIGELLMRPRRLLVEYAAKSLLVHEDLITDAFLDKMYQLYSIPGTSEATLQTLRVGVDVRGQSAAFPPDALHRIAAPTWVVWGERDNLFPVRHAEAALHSIPDCRAVVLREAGHAPQMDRAATFNELALEFLDNGQCSVNGTVLDKQLVYL